MKGKLSAMLRSGLSLMLVLCMLVSMAPAAFAAGDYYVALGDGASVSESYVDLVADELGVSYKNLAVKDQTMVQALAYIDANANEIKKADVITLGYGVNALTYKGVMRGLDAMLDREYESFDWADMEAQVEAMNPELAAQLPDIEETLVTVENMLLEYGLPDRYASATAKGIEGFTYYAVEYLLNLPRAIKSIRAINADAPILVVGLYNPLAGISLNVLGETMSGDMLTELVAYVDAYAIEYSEMFENTHYVSVPGVKTDIAGQEYDLIKFMNTYRSTPDLLEPSAEGHAYIKEQLVAAMKELDNGSNKPAPSENPFVDVAEENYFYEAVLWAVANEITGGLDATHFGPNNACTRGQVVTFLWRANGSPAPKSTSHPFTDISADKFYYEAVLWAVENGITSGLNATTFGPNNACTRGQIATFLWRANGSPEPQSSNNPFSDVNAGPFYKAILWAVEEGVTGGYSDGTFRPNNVCTRGNIVTFLFRAEQ